MVAITHDRYFLDNVAKWILELDRGKGIPYEGNYSGWLVRLVQRAVELDSSLSEARTALALSLGNLGQWRAAEREFRRAIELAPSDPGARYWYGMLLVGLGRGAEALAGGSSASWRS